MVKNYESDSEFSDDLADFVSPEAVAEVTVTGRRELAPVPGIQYAAFIDPSGGSSDAMALAVGHLRDDGIGVLDYLHEVRAPFDPDNAVEQCVNIIKRYGISTIRGDRYAGEWVPARFKECGILFEQSARPKSDLYGDLLPLINAQRVELLDNRRLSAQLVGLERRTSRSGKDSIDHGPGGHDDCANAAAGVLVGLDLDRRPRLVRQESISAAVDMPSSRNSAIYAVLYPAKDGSAAIVYCYKQSNTLLLILDFDAGFFSPAFLDGCVARLYELHNSIPRSVNYETRLAHAQWETGYELIERPILFVPPPGEGRPSVSSFGVGLAVEKLPPVPVDQLKIHAARLVEGGRVRLTSHALEKGRRLPFGGALDFRPGADLDGDPLRAAATWAIAATFSPQHQLMRLVG